ncbi:hypothetical protein V6N12_043679 [Hibiscus sabdariffa]|uniref:Uncharacterized protein n=1 Tax=Hibiscus sabdariffa TaxID=183260 RepID=A0ABR2DGQ1_9ROSI
MAMAMADFPPRNLMNLNDEAKDQLFCFDLIPRRHCSSSSLYLVRAGCADGLYERIEEGEVKEAMWEWGGSYRGGSGPAWLNIGLVKTQRWA